MKCETCKILKAMLKHREKIYDMLLGELERQDNRVCDLEDELRELARHHEECHA